MENQNLAGNILKNVSEFYFNLDRRFILLMIFINLPNALASVNVIKLDGTIIRHVFQYLLYVFFFYCSDSRCNFFY